MPGEQKRKKPKKSKKPYRGASNLGSGAAANAARAIRKKHQRLKDI